MQHKRYLMRQAFPAALGSTGRWIVTGMMAAAGGFAGLGLYVTYAVVIAVQKDKKQKQKHTRPESDSRK